MRRAPGRGLPGLALLALACAAAPDPELVRVSDGRQAMGTILEVTLFGPRGAIDAGLVDPVYAEVARLEAIFTSWSDASDLSRMNAAAGSGPQPLVPELARILDDCEGFSARTLGSFDVTVGPLVALWKRAAERERRPTPEELEAARARVGFSRVVRLEDGRVDLPAGSRVDLAGVAKGWALDRVVERLRAQGVERALLDFGRSSIVALGAPPGEAAWRVLLRDPESGVESLLALRDRALSVSSSLGQWVTLEGRRYGHVIDPRSGEPLTRAYQAVAVAPSAAEAEAWSKALLVLGPEEGIALATARPGVEGLLTDASGQRFATPGFPRSGDVP